MSPRYPFSLRSFFFALLWSGGAAALARGASVEEQLSALYTPFRVQQAALAPDGRHVAFTVLSGRGNEVLVYEIGSNEQSRRFPLEERPDAETALLAWSSPDRLVAASAGAIVVAIDLSAGTRQMFSEASQPVRSADGRAARGAGGGPGGAGLRTTRVLSGPLENPDTVFIETISPTPRPGTDGAAIGEADDFDAGNHATLQVHRLDLRTGQREIVFRRALPPPGGSVMIDWQGTPRLVFNRGALPQRYSYRAAAAGGPWTDLDRVLDDRKIFAFAVRPENFFGARTIPLGFGADPNLLFYASNLERDTFAIHAVNLRNGKRTSGGIENAQFDLASPDAPWTRSPLVFDRKRRILAGVRIDGLQPATHWIDPQLAAVQATLGEKFPGRNVQVLDWDEARDRFVALVGSPGDPGRYFVFHRTADRCVEYLRRAPALEHEDFNRVEHFSFVTPAGGRPSGTITLPHTPGASPPALVVWLRDATAGRAGVDFDRDAQALAAMGFAVAQVNYAGSPGFGRLEFDAMHRDLDRRPLADVLATIEWLSSRHTFDRGRVAVVGEGFGGYLALRALQLHGEAFRCAVAIDAPVDLADLKRKPLRFVPGARGFGRGGGARGGGAGADEGGLDSAGAQPPAPAIDDDAAGLFNAFPPSGPSVMEGLDFEGEFLRWFVSGQPRLGDIAVTRHPELLTKPVFLVHHLDARRAPVAVVRELRDQLVRRKLAPTYLEIGPVPAGGANEAREKMLRKIGEFLNAKVYDSAVKTGGLIGKE